MISGAAQADVALLMVPSNKGGFETSIAKGNHKKGEVQGQTRQHARLCHLLGIEQVICGINKMDDKSVNWSEDRYKEIKGEVDKMLTKIGYALCHDVKWRRSRMIRLQCALCHDDQVQNEEDPVYSDERVER